MTNPTEALKELLEKHVAAPFLFVGSGFSRRYLGLGDWAGLLKRFCEPIRDFGYYSSKANGDLPLAASYMASDYNEWWWSAPEAAERRTAAADSVQDRSDALKHDIAAYMSGFSLEDARGSEFGQEIAAFSEIAVDGIITTNWDYLLEELFPDYRVFTGQQELLFSNPQSIGEIYKIHGSISDPHSLVLTAEDYEEFSSKNPYLAAKLVTIFVEHPIIFLGYSIADPHIRAIISSIARCLPQDKIEAFQKNLVFVQRTKNGESPSVEKTTIQPDDFSVTMMIAKVSDFGQVYAALTGGKRKLPARVLRFFKEQLYELVHASEGADKKLAVVDFDEIENADEVEFVVGVGVAKHRQEFGEKAEARLAAKGYAGVAANELFADCLTDASQFDGENLLGSAFPIFARQDRIFIPVFRYLKAAGIITKADLLASKFEGAKKIVQKLEAAEFTYPSYRKRFETAFVGLSTAEIIQKASSAGEAVIMISFQPDEELDIPELKKFLRNVADKITNQPYLSQYRKLVCRYDRLVYGFGAML